MQDAKTYYDIDFLHTPHRCELTAFCLLVTGGAQVQEEALALLSLKSDLIRAPFTSFLHHNLSVELAGIQGSSKGSSLGALKRFLKDHVQRSTDKQLILCTYGSKRSRSHLPSPFPSPSRIPPAKVESRQRSPDLRMFQPLILISETKDLYHLIELTKSSTHTHTDKEDGQ